MQNSLSPEIEANIDEWKIYNFSAENKCISSAREELENKYFPLTEVSDKFNRQSVSYQLSKKDSLHRWLKYKEGYSAELVRILLDEFGLKPNDTILDPFLGSGTTALVSCLNGYNSIGFDILPMSEISIKAKMSIFNYNIAEIKKFIDEIESLSLPKGYKKETASISITKDGYPKETAKEIAFFSDYIAESEYSKEIKNLAKLCILNSLERISYSAKDGQYLRWDRRCPKIIAAAKEREEKGKKPFVVTLDKGELPSLKQALLEELNHVFSDIQQIQQERTTLENSKCNFINGSALFEMPKLEANSINGVVTSPPYCNRYDYTRTYAMELVYLGVDETGIRKLRQDLLSCTVESKSKIEILKDVYDEIGRSDDYNNILSIAKSNKTLQEINAALSERNANGEINNKGVLRMVDGYFTELTFIFAEIYRLCQKGSYVAFVNDNVRYAGEVIPVDFLTSELAEQLGFKVVKIYSLKQKKGNSSQQMKKYGRVALRKSITIWKKE